MYNLGIKYGPYFFLDLVIDIIMQPNHSKGMKRDTKGEGVGWKSEGESDIQTDRQTE